MRTVDEKEIRFKLKFALQNLPRSVLRDLNAAPDKREPALSLATDLMWQHLSRYRFEADDPLRPH